MSGYVDRSAGPSAPLLANFPSQLGGTSKGACKGVSGVFVQALQASLPARATVIVAARICPFR